MLTILTLYLLIRHTMASDRAAVIAVALAAVGDGLLFTLGLVWWW